MAATEGGAGGPITIGSPITSYICFDKVEFQRNLASRLYSNSSFTSLKNGAPIDPQTIAKDCINKAQIFWEIMPAEWKGENI